MSNKPRPDRKSERQQEGLERLEAWQSFTPEQKLASLHARRGKSKRQVKKLTEALGE